MSRLFVHQLATAVSAPGVVLSDRDGQLRPGGPQGFLTSDVRHLSELTVLVDGAPPVGLAHARDSASELHFVGVVPGLGDENGDRTVRLERFRRVRPDHLLENLALVNDARTEITTTITVRVAADLVPILAVRSGAPTTPVRPAAQPGVLAGWTAGSAATALTADVDPDSVELASDHVLLTWELRLPPRTAADLVLTVTTRAVAEHPVVAAPADRDIGRLLVTSADTDLDQLVSTGIADLRDLLLADPAAPADRFAGAGTPWYLTLFGRDSLWAARFALPLGTDLALGTLRTLARRQGTKHDPETAEEPGKMPHEVRQLPVGLDRRPGLPPTYYGTIDATPLWISLLHDAWRWGLPASDVEALLAPLRRALDWLLGHTFLSYVDESGRGLANQGWKDSVDSIQDGSGNIAVAPIVLCEAQAYAHRAALDAAALLTAFDRPGAEEALAFAAGLRDRFRDVFWVDGFPAVALDGAGRPVDTLTSNLGHLLGTGLLSPAEESAVAGWLADPALDSGFGLRTMAATHPYFNPIGYHTGSVWPHDTAIAVDGLARTGHASTAASLAKGLVRAGARFDHRLPELYGGWSEEQGPLLDYPSACRPQAWAAAAGAVLVRAALGLEADVPGGRLTVRPATEFAAWFPMRVKGLSVAGHALAVEVDAEGRPAVLTDAPLEIVVNS